MKKVGFILIGLVFSSGFWTCNIGDKDDDQVPSMSIKVDETLLDYDSIVVIMNDSSGAVMDKLFQGSLNSLEELKNLPVPGYRGEKVYFIIRGFTDSVLLYEEIRFYDGTTQTILASGTTVENGDSLEVAYPEVVFITRDTAVYVNDSLRLYVKAIHSERNITKYTWDYDGDGTVDDSAYVDDHEIEITGVHKYTEAGKYYVVFQVMDQLLNTTEDTVEVWVVPGDIPAILSITNDTVIIVGDSVALRGRVMDEDGSIIFYSWDYDGDGTWEDSTVVDKSTLTASGGWKYTVDGHYLAVLRIRDDDDNENFDTVRVRVRTDGNPYVVSATGDTGITEGDSVFFQVLIRDEDGLIVYYTLDLDGDGEFDDSTESDKPEVNIRAGRRYKETGTFHFIWQASDDDGNIIRDSIEIRVEKKGRPVIMEITQDTTITVGDVLALQAVVRDDGGVVAGHYWDYNGDGAWDSTFQDDEDVVIIKTHWKYDSSGSMSTILRVVDDDGNSVYDTVRVLVETNEPPHIDSLTKDTVLFINDSLEITARILDYDGQVVYITCDYNGDGDIEDTATVNTADTSVHITRHYPDTGSYSTIITVTDDDGNVVSDTVTVTVAYSSDATLSDLSISKGALDPKFKPVTLIYSAEVSYEDSMITFTPTVNHPKASVSVNSISVESGNSSQLINLPLSMSTINVVVTAQDGNQQKYEITAKRMTRLIMEQSIEGLVSQRDTTDILPNLPHAISADSLIPSHHHFVSWTQTGGTGTAVFGSADSSTTTATVTDGPAVIQSVIEKDTHLVHLTFSGSGTASPSDTSVKYGDSITIVAYPVHGWHFTGWSLISGSGVIADTSDNTTTLTVNSDIELKAVFSINQYTVDFDAGDGTAVANQTIDYGGLAAEPAEPTRIGRSFGGWYKDSAYTNAWIFPTDKVTTNVTLYAKWNVHLDLVAYYPFNGNANDESGNGNDGTANGVNLVEDRFGNSNCSYRFDGIDDYINVPDSEGWNFGSEDFTISSWVRATDLGEDYLTIISQRSEAPVNMFNLNIRPLTQKVDFAVYTNASPLDLFPPLDINLSAQAWQHIAVVRKNNYINCYWNGKALLSGAGHLMSGEMPDVVGSDVLIGAYYLPRQDIFDGNIDDILIYKRALGPGEIDSLYHIGGWPTTADPSLYLIDSRDDRIYKKVTIGTQTWVAENLNYTPNSGNSWCYNDSTSNCSTFGRLYDWNTAVADNHGNGKDICPTGWHLPSDAEFKTMEMAMGMSQADADAIGLRGPPAGEKLKSTSWDGTDDFQFSALPAGGHYTNGPSDGLGNGAYFWTATEYNAFSAWFRNMNSGNDGVYRNSGYDKGNGLSVRCLKD